MPSVGCWSGSCASTDRFNLRQDAPPTGSTGCFHCTTIFGVPAFYPSLKAAKSWVTIRCSQPSTSARHFYSGSDRGQLIDLAKDKVARRHDLRACLRLFKAECSSSPRKIPPAASKRAGKKIDAASENSNFNPAKSGTSPINGAAANVPIVPPLRSVHTGIQSVPDVPIVQNGPVV